VYFPALLSFVSISRVIGFKTTLTVLGDGA